MEKDIYDFWIDKASINDSSELDSLCKVLDPRDVKGVKNSYLDFYLKYYLQQHLCPRKEDTLLEVGCGIGRLTEYMSSFSRTVYGIDLVDQFIDQCKCNPNKNDNTFYLKACDLENLKYVTINKMYIVWVLMYLTSAPELINTLRGYREILPHLKRFVVLEQVKRNFQVEKHQGKVYCCYRTVEEYKAIFHAAGFKVSNYSILGERNRGLAYNSIRLTCNVLPRYLARWSNKLFYFDKYLMGNAAKNIRLINDRRPTDVAFVLEVA